ncbi:hypothetical protein [Spirochaeta isovalerica]|uniref:Uncharacterized protein n=1 Tax=Spirochaeta isovalerica TaxID=150 RepID=A0A841RCX2_9SPIO|nr:hypothetical protein [Spirochaeta isovalerica]MBB6481855.1 hypothetical protein [Spirochaeta isovalerica]
MYEKERAAAREFNRQLEHLEDRVFGWGIRKYKLDKAFANIHGPYMDSFDGFPDNYVKMMIAAWLFSRVLLDPELIIKFARNEKESLFPIHNGYLKYWKKHQPIWSLFYIREKKDDDVLVIEDQLTEKTMLLHSRNMAGMDTDKPIISLLFPLEEGIWVSYGIIRQYKGSFAYHLLDLMRLMDEELYEAEDFTSFIHKYYGCFFQIDQTMESPLVINKKELVEKNWMEIILLDFDPYALSKKFNIDESSGIVRLKAKSNDPFPFSEIYFNSETEEAYFSSMTLKGYRELCKLVNDYELPEEPDYIFSMPLYTVMEKDMGMSFPGDYWESFFASEEEVSPEAKEEIEVINIIVKEAFDAENQGLPFDLKKRGAELGLDGEAIKSIEEMLARIRNSMNNPE